MVGNMISAASEAASKSSSGSLNILLIIVVLFGVLYFVMIRPQRNRQRKAQEQARAVTPGTRVRTTAGMYATVVGVDGDDVILEVAPGVEVRYVKRAIMQVLPSDAEPDYAADHDEGDAHVDAPSADAEADDYEADDYEAADHEDADHEPVGQETSEHEAAGDEGADHDGDEPPAPTAGDPQAHAGDESPSGRPG